MTRLTLELRSLDSDSRNGLEVGQYDLAELRQRKWEWDRVVKGTHLSSCAWQQACSFNLYVKDGVVLREEQAGQYPGFNDPDIPDFNPRGCQKGACYSHRMYDPTRIKYPMRRVGERGAGKWERITWDEALTEVADAIIDTLLTDGPEAIVNGGGTRVSNNNSEGIGADALYNALDNPFHSSASDIGDEFQGVGITFGKAMIAGSPDNYFYADLVLLWGGNPAYTSIPNYHFLSEARYHGSKIVAICPNYSATAIHADLWLPVNIGTDAALALSMCQVILREGLAKTEFIREQTDLPLLVVEGTGRFLRERDLKRNGREDVFYVWDEATGRLAEAPRKTLALNGILPALDGSYQVETLKGRLGVRPVLALLWEQLDRDYTPQQASASTGVPASQIEQLAREIAMANGVTNHTTTNWGKFYHGTLIERAIILLVTLSGHLGRKGAVYNAFDQLSVDTSVGGLERRGDQMLLSAAGADPRWAQWREEGYTDEMILYEYVHEAFERGRIIPSALMFYLHGGLLEQAGEFNNWDPYLKRPVQDYVKEAFEKGWQYPAPPKGKEPRVVFGWGGNFLRRVRGTNAVFREFLPKIRKLICVDWRWNTTALYSDVVLPVCGWYERTGTFMIGRPEDPFAHAVVKATEPMYESKTDWAVFVLIARAIEERARERGIATWIDSTGAERRFAGLADKVTARGMYMEDDEEGVARDLFLNARNLERMDWEEFKEKGIASYTGFGSGVRGLGHASDLVQGEPIIPLTWHIGEQKLPYPTLTRRIQFYIDQDLYLELGEALPTFKANPPIGGNYPLAMTGGHARWALHSEFVDDALMLQLQRGEPAMFMNSADAQARGIRDGDRVEVFNDIGRFSIGTIVSPAMRPGQVAVYHAWENYQFKDWQHFKTVQATPLNPVELAGGYFQIRPGSIFGQPGLNDRGTRVEVRKIGA
jgi:DMSO reductase family type II enzyme molybdopterin subunit